MIDWVDLRVIIYYKNRPKVGCRSDRSLPKWFTDHNHSFGCFLSGSALLKLCLGLGVRILGYRSQRTQSQYTTWAKWWPRRCRQARQRLRKAMPKTKHRNLVETDTAVFTGRFTVLVKVNKMKIYSISDQGRTKAEGGRHYHYQIFSRGGHRWRP